MLNLPIQLRFIGHYLYGIVYIKDWGLSTYVFLSIIKGINDIRKGAHLTHMKAKLTKYKVWNNICIFLFILTPLIAAVLFCLRDGKLIRDIYIPLGGWSDEITYYKQIEGILSHGMPRGYFGYNQSKALCGTLGVWGIIPLIPYIIWGFFFGWNYCSPIYANIFFCMVALLGIYIILRPKKRWMGMISFFWIANQFLNRYVLSGVIEASVTAQLLLVTACGLYLLSDTIRGQQERKFTPKKDNAVLILCTILICFMTLARPYFAVLYLIPLWKAFKDKRKGWIFTLPFIAIAVILLFSLTTAFSVPFILRIFLHLKKYRKQESEVSSCK